MSQIDRLPDPALRDRRWVGYHPRATAPTVVFAGAISLILWTGRYYLDDLSDLADRVGALAVFAMSWGVWPALSAILLYRTITYTYRLTDRAVLIDFGFLSLPIPPIPLAEITNVSSGGRWLARQLGVGWVEIRAGVRTVRLSGVRRAEEFALAIRAAVLGKPTASTEPV